MSAELLAAHAPLALFAMCALGLFAVGEVFGRRLRQAPVQIRDPKGRKMMPLLEAAAEVHKSAKRERLALAVVSEQSPETSAPTDWFVRNMVTVVPVYRQNGPGSFEKLRPPIDVGTQSQSLYIRKRDYQNYMRWIRTVQ